MIPMKRNVGILTFPISEAGNIPLSNLVGILEVLSNDLYLITGNDGYAFFKEDTRIHAYGIKHESGASVFARILRYIYTQLRISFKLAKIRRNVDLWVFFIGGEGLLLPMLTAMVLGKKVVIASAGSGLKIAQAQKNSLAKMFALLQSISYRLSDRIIIYSGRLIEEYGLQKYRNKFSVAHEHFLDFDRFKIKKAFGERDNLVGYIGRLSQEKGVINFVKAIPEISKEKEDMKFLLGGNGQLKDEIEEYLNREYLNGKVKLAGWIPHDELPEYLNEFKLVVLPSYTEGLPNVILEAMACGTPVLATPVGAIPDVIKDGETGFIMENNSPECIAKNIIRALNHPDLGRIAENGRRLVEREFTFEKAVKRWKKILEREI